MRKEIDRVFTVFAFLWWDGGARAYARRGFWG